MSGKNHLRAVFLRAHASRNSNIERAAGSQPKGRARRSVHQSPRLRSLVVGALALFLVTGICPALAQVQYSYDPNGRLVKVTMPNGAFATYAYDPDGNILSISNSAATAVSITAMTPQSGPVGSTVTLQGSGFDPVVANDTVQFNGTSAVVTAASASSLQATVPSGATSGTVSVTNSHGSAVAPVPFNVVANNAPTITQISPVAGAEGAAVTITGTGFNPSKANDSVSFGGIATSLNSATATSIVAVVPTQSSSGKVSVTTAGGQTTSTADFFAIPNSVTPSAVTTKIRIQPSAAAQTVTVASQIKAAVMIFDAVSGQKMYFQPTASTISLGSTLTVYSPTGSIVFNTLITNTNGAFSADRLPVTGTYTALLTVNSGGHVKYQLLPGPSDISGQLPTDSSTISLNLAVDQGASYTFSGNAGQLFDIQTTVPDGATLVPRFFVQDSQGNVIADNGYTWFGATTMHLPALPATGTYTARFSPVDLGTSSATVQLISVPAPVTGTLTVDGAPQNLQLLQYQSASYTFSGTAGQRLFLEPAQSTFDSTLYAIVTAPDGTQVLNTIMNGSTAEADDLTALPVNGVYTVRIMTSDDGAGSMTLALNTKPADQVVSATVNGAPVQVSLAFDQDGQVSFVGAANQSLWIQPTAYSFGNCVNAVLSDASNTVLVATLFCDASPTRVDLGQIAASGTYHIELTRSEDPSAGATTLSVKSVPSDKTGTITVNGAAVTASLGVHQNGHYTISGTAGNVLTIATSAQTLDSSTYLQLFAPDGSSVDLWFPASPSDSHTLPALPSTGTYVLEIVPSTTTAGKITLKATK
ncbi:IPT/TIG domain-containing protein [Caballeronia sordidicola]|uniref:IPT/TIG domain-containing protein n=1 Tax=Caballeronia sordidicola TaxID=196367 RepID=A0A226WT64_CABSO|nr:IPT/TIG domain-containing protein [Caballeronia sordidicola]OXC74361.1 hypothetical protein BSU04_32395 [Caballeronia sordidicola]